MTPTAARALADAVMCSCFVSLLFVQHIQLDPPSALAAFFLLCCCYSNYSPGRFFGFRFPFFVRLSEWSPFGFLSLRGPLPIAPPTVLLSSQARPPSRQPSQVCQPASPPPSETAKSPGSLSDPDASGSSLCLYLTEATPRLFSCSSSRQPCCPPTEVEPRRVSLVELLRPAPTQMELGSTTSAER